MQKHIEFTKAFENARPPIVLIQILKSKMKIFLNLLW